MKYHICIILIVNNYNFEIEFCGNHQWHEAQYCCTELIMR